MRRGNTHPWRAAAAVFLGNAAGNAVAAELLGARAPWLTRAFGPSLAPVTLSVPYLGAVTFGFDLEVTTAGLLGIAAALVWLRRR